jgi:hypothetical protein
MASQEARPTEDKKQEKEKREVNPAGNTETSPWMSPRQLEKETGIKAWQWGQYIRSGALPPGIVVRLGGRTFIIRSRFNEFLAQGGLDTRKRPNGKKTVAARVGK